MADVNTTVADVTAIGTFVLADVIAMVSDVITTQGD